jgi:glycosyltransferase involved in cell wall biosynthesis
LREKREAELCGSDTLKIAARKTKKIEIGVMRKAHRTIVVSEAEYEMLRRLAPNISVSLVSLPREIPGRRKNFKDRRDIVFIGGYNHPPNIDAVQFFVSEIWPIVTEALPDAKFIVAGSNMPDSISQLSGKNIVVRGYVEDLGEIFDHCRLSVAPLRCGAGVKGKVVTSLSYGVPCVGTAIAIEGMGLVHGENILLADTVEDFANAVVEAYTSAKLWNKLSRNGLDVVRERFSVESVRSALHDVLQDLGLG